MNNKHVIYILKILVVMILALCVIAFTTSCFVQTPRTDNYRFSSNGERIYYTSTSSSGQPIGYSGSFRMMHPIACVNCHGTNGQGGRIHMMMQNFDVPDISWHKLIEEEHEEEDEEEHEEHPPYTEETIKIAIIKGINPAGEPLDEEMPRWKMTDNDLNDLVNFMKTLE
jgi:mono/diheme cytochrome c family protein